MTGHDRVRGGGVPRGRADRGGERYAHKALRDEAIIEGRLNGRTVKELAEDFGITQRSVSRICKQGVEAPTALDAVPMELVQRVLRSYERELENWSRVAAQTIDSYPAVAVAALRGHSEARQRWLAVVQAIQKLPGRLEIFRYESDIDRLGRAVIAALAKFEAGDLGRDELLETVREAINPSLPTVEGTEAG